MAATEQLYSVAQVAQMMSLSKSSVRRYISDGEIEIVRLGKSGKTIRIPESEIEIIKSTYKPS